MIDGADGMIATLDDLKSQEIDNARQSGSYFSTTGDVDSYLDYMTNYNATFTKCATFSEKYEAFSEKLTDRDIYSKLSSDETSVLQKVSSTGLGTDVFYSSTQYREAIIPEYDNFKRLESGQVNDSVENTLFRIAKANAVKAYDTDLKTNINNMFTEYKSSKAAYDQCGVSTKVRELNTTWSSVVSVMEMKAAPLTSEYEAAYLSIQQSKLKYNAIVDGMSSCGTTATPKAATTSSSMDLPILFLVAILAVYGFVQYRKWQKQKQEEEEGA